MSASNNTSADSSFSAAMLAQDHEAMQEIGRLRRQIIKLQQDKAWYKEHLRQSRRHVRGLRAEVADLRDYSTRVLAINEALTANTKIESHRADKYFQKYRDAMDELYEIKQSREPLA